MRVVGRREPHTGQPALTASARVPTLDSQTHEFELGHDAGGKLDPSVLQLCIAHRSAPSPSQRIQQHSLLLVERNHIMMRKSRAQTVDLTHATPRAGCSKPSYQWAGGANPKQARK